MTAEQLKEALRQLSVPERRQVLDGIALPRSVKLGGAATIASRCRQLGLLEEVERALNDWQTETDQENER